MAKIYVASSWRNEYQQETVKLLRKHGHAVYDFHNPPKTTGFEWANISKDYLDWTRSDYITALQTREAGLGFRSDFDAMKWANTFIQILPSGISASLEMGWAVGQGKHTFVYLASPKFEPELMFKTCDHIAYTIEAILHALSNCKNE